MPPLTAPMREHLSKKGWNAPRVPTNTQGFEVPEMDAMAHPQHVEPTVPAPNLEPPPIVNFKLHQHTGDFVLPRGERQGGAVRTVTENDIEEFLEWGVPRFAEEYPDCTREAMLPFIRMVICSNAYKAVRTDNCFGLFTFARLPWIPRGIVSDVAVVSRKEDHPNQHKGVEITRVCRAALEWAMSLNAAQFYLGAVLGPVGKRLGMDETGTSYQKDL